MHELLENILLREILAIRIDSLWRMLSLQGMDRLPAPGEEGATGEFDNKGAMFIPAGLVRDDSDHNPVQLEKTGPWSENKFRAAIRKAMNHDNATLLDPSGIAVGVNLDNGRFATVAANILANKQAAWKRRATLEKKPTPRFDSSAITRSHSPTFVEPPYGSRSRLSGCLAVCLMEPRMYHVEMRRIYGLRDESEARVWRGIRQSQKPLRTKTGAILAPPAIVVCHTARYHSNNLCAMTRILGYGKFGQFATVGFEKIRVHLLEDAGLNPDKFDEGLVAVELDDLRIACVFRTYSATQPGRRHKKTTTSLIDLHKLLGADLEKASSRARAKYFRP